MDQHAINGPGHWPGVGPASPAAEVRLAGVGVDAPRGQRLLDGIELDFAPGVVNAIVGPNGAGKTTLLRLLYGYLRPTRGQVLLDGADIARMPPRQLARHVAAVPQGAVGDAGLTVRQVVALGRVPHGAAVFARTHEGDAAVDAAIDRLGLVRLADRLLGQLSGGERQRVMIARAVAQAPRVLVLDEPTNHLDIRHQLELLRDLRALDATVIVTLHDLNAAVRHADRLTVLQGGRIAATGAPAQVLSSALISRVFGVTARGSANGTMEFSLPATAGGPDPKPQPASIEERRSR